MIRLALGLTFALVTSASAQPLTAAQARAVAFAANTHPVNAAPDWQGQAFSRDGKYLLFKVYSARASRVQVDVYDAADRRVAQFPLTRDIKTGLWYAAIPRSDAQVQNLNLGPGLFSQVTYGLRAWGPNWPYHPSWKPGSSAGFQADVDAAGNRFNPNKLLLDPYALEVNRDFIRPGQLNGAIYASGKESRTIDSGPWAARAYIANTHADAWKKLPSLSGLKPTRHDKDDVIYEVHLRGFTMNDPGIPAKLRGTYAGAARKARYLKDLGVTAVEFLPIQETENAANDVNAGGRSATTTAGDNYWGYMTTAFFAPDRRYSSDQTPGGPTREFALMAQAFHAAGIKVLADVVYNHSGEGGLWNSQDTSKLNLWSLRGLDNSSYYLLTNDKQHDYDITGTGNTLNTRHPQVQRLILDSLKHLRTLGVDGFRFDLGIALGNSYDNTTNPGDPQRFYFSRNGPNTALSRIAQAFPGVRLSSEPWGLAPGGQGYQLGNFPADWSEWNGQYRDFMRRAQNKLGLRPVTPGQLISRLAGSSDLFGDDGRKPWHSINFLTVHDGFTLKDLYACNARNNKQAWPFGPSDGGSDDEDSWDSGGNASLQRQQARTALLLLSMSQGVPLINGGDELLRSLNCNNNPYNLDSVGNWLNWNLNATQQTFQTFTRELLKFRAQHPALRRAEFFNGRDNNGNGLKDVTWFTAQGLEASRGWFNNPQEHALAYRIDGTEASDGVLYVAYNGWQEDVTFTLPAPPAGTFWNRVTDTAAWAEGSKQVKRTDADPITSDRYTLRARSALLLIAR